jgi:hypothetical protein
MLSLQMEKMHLFPRFKLCVYHMQMPRKKTYINETDS